VTRPSDKTSSPFARKSLIFAPHCDDAALSLGGAIAGKLLGEVRVIVTCSKTNYTAFGRKAVDIITRVRRQEELNALDGLVSRIEFLDYEDWSVSPRTSPELPLEAQTAVRHAAEDYLKIASTAVFFPASIGEHPDHIGLFRVGTSLSDWKNLHFYEDMPYRLGANAKPIMSNCKRTVLNSSFAPKRALLRFYRSQSLFLYFDALKTFHETVGGEVIWTAQHTNDAALT